MILPQNYVHVFCKTERYIVYFPKYFIIQGSDMNPRTISNMLYIFGVKMENLWLWLFFIFD